MVVNILLILRMKDVELDILLDYNSYSCTQKKVSSYVDEEPSGYSTGSSQIQLSSSQTLLRSAVTSGTFFNGGRGDVGMEKVINYYNSYSCKQIKVSVSYTHLTLPTIYSV